MGKQRLGQRAPLAGGAITYGDGGCSEEKRVLAVRLPSPSVLRGRVSDTVRRAPTAGK